MHFTEATDSLESCDTMVVVAAASATGSTIFAKNSDRNPNEAQYLTVVEGGEHEAGEMVECTYVSIPQAPRTYRVLGSRPYWIWGFEHGVNEKGVAVGNEALFAKAPASADPGLIGMDYVRLVLERAATADEGVQVLTSILEEHGQSGRTSTLTDRGYDNGYIIADAETAWMVETAGKHWVAKRVKDVGRISNAYSVGADYDLISAGAIEYATENGWYDPAAGEPFDFAQAFQDWDIPFLPACVMRLNRSAELMGGKFAAGKLSVEDMIENLRDVRGDSARTFIPGRPDIWTINRHADRVHGSETAAAMVAELSPAGYALVALAGPRLSSFVPVWFDDIRTDDVPWEQPETAADADPWWETERFQRLVERDYRTFAAAAEEGLGSIDARVLQAIRALGPDAGVEERREITRTAVRLHDEFMRHYGDYLRAVGDALVDPEFEDPRGTYLVDVAAAEPATDRASVGGRRY